MHRSFGSLGHVDALDPVPQHMAPQCLGKLEEPLAPGQPGYDVMKLGVKFDITVQVAFGYIFFLICYISF